VRISVERQGRKHTNLEENEASPNLADAHLHIRINDEFRLCARRGDTASTVHATVIGNALRPSDPLSVLFVCLGNICRSPLAEGVFRHMAEKRSLGERFVVDSAGTAGYHSGEAPDSRAIAVAVEHGLPLLDSRARKVTLRDLQQPGLVIAMDRSNLRVLKRLRGGSGQATVRLMRDYDPDAPGADVPDPYYGGPEGFEEVFRILDRSCRALLDKLVAQQSERREFPGEG